MVPAAAEEGIPAGGYSLPCASPGPSWGGGREGAGVVVSQGIKKERHPTALAVRAPKCQRLGVSLARFMIAHMFYKVKEKIGADFGRSP